MFRSPLGWRWRGSILLLALVIGLVLLVLDPGRDRIRHDEALPLREQPHDRDSSDASIAIVDEATTMPPSRDAIDPPSPSSKGLRFLVLDQESNEPVVGAELAAIAASHAPVDLGRTDADGYLRCSLPFEEDEYVHVAVEASGFAQQTRNVGFVRDGEVEVLLAESASIRGTVVDPTGAPVPFANVLAFPTSKRISDLEQVAWIRNGWWPGAMGTCDATGTFTLEGLAPDVHHVVQAGSAAGISDGRDTAVPGQGARLTVALRQLVGAHVEVLEEDGDPLPSVALASSEGFFWGSRGVEPLPMSYRTSPVAGSFVLALTGLEAGSLLSQEPSTFLLLGLRSPEASGPALFEYGARWPGFREASGQGTLEPWGPGFPVRTVTLSPSGAVGILVVTFQMDPALAERRSTYSMPVASIAIQGVESRGSKQFEIGRLDRPSRFSVPIGLHEIQCMGGLGRAVHWTTSSGQREIVIQEGREAHVTFLVQGVGSLLFQIEDPEHPGYDGRVDLLLRGQTAAGWAALSPTLMRPPYRLPWVVAGDYEVQEVRAPGNEGHRSYPTLIRVEPGAESSVTLTLE